MANVAIRPAQPSDRDQLVEMRVLLWPESSAGEQRQELDASLGGGASGTLPAIHLVSLASDGSLTGFLEASLRSHADGCDVRHPAGYVEGWFVREAHRGRGVGAALLRAAEDWARLQGCREMASDALIDNQGSQRAHQALGFAEVDRCVHYRKPL
jgi:aminoglycoside 6'-N-acetyltransferase I